MNVSAKLGNMRSGVEWTVYPARKDGTIVIQSEHRICAFRADGHGVLSKHVGSGAYFVHLSPACGAVEVVVPEEVVKAALAGTPAVGSEVGPGVYVG